MMRRGNGAFAALALAGLAYVFKNRQQLTGKFQQFGNRVQGQLSGPTTAQAQPATAEPRVYTGETTRI